MSNDYKISVITAVLNGGSDLEQAIESVSQQTYPAIEYIMVDGGSTDGSLELIERPESRVDCCISGADSGIAEAMNKGIAAATGDFLLFLHSDDRFVDADALRQAMAYVDDLAHIWAFDVQFGEGPTRRVLRPRPFSMWARFRNPLPHQGVLVSRRVFDRLGAFDQRWQIAMDYDFWLRAIEANIQLSRIPLVLSVMGTKGVSSRTDWGGLSARFAEEREIQFRHKPGLSWSAVYAAFWPLYRAYRWSRYRL